MKAALEIDMPDDCVSCTISANTGDCILYCPVLYVYFNEFQYEEKRNPDCPLKPVEGKE